MMQGSIYMQYCIYLRKSRADLEAESRGEGETLARHERVLLDLANKHSLPITEIYKEVVSGETIAARPVMQHLLSQVGQGMWEGVLVMEVERLARGDTVDQGIVSQAFKYSNTKIITPMKVYDPNNEFDEEYFEFGLFMSRREYKVINRRLQRGRIESVKEGKYVGSITPYGYIRKKIEKQKGYTLEINPEQADIVKMIFELYTKGELQDNGTLKRLGVALIVRKLNDMKIPPMNGDVWVPGTLQNMLRNPVYIGKIRWNARPTVKKIIDGQMKKERPRAKKNDWILCDGLHEAIIDEETWNIAQSLLAKNDSRPCPSKQTIKNPLSGLVICGLCGRRLVRRPYSNKYPETLMCPSTACSNISSQLSYVEERLYDALLNWLDEYKMSWETEKENNPSSNIQLEVKKKSIKKLEAEIENLEKQMNNLHDLLEQGVYSIDKFNERSKILSEKMCETKAKLKTFTKEIDLEEAKEINKAVIIPKIEKVLEVYKLTDDPALKNELLKEIVDKAVYVKTVSGRWSGKPDEFDLVIYPKSPNTYFLREGQ